MKQTILIPFTFEANYPGNNNSSSINPDNVIDAWATVIYIAVSNRLNHCKLELFDNRNRVSVTDEHTIIYYTETGARKHYSLVAAQAMEDIIGLYHEQYLESIKTDPAMLTQILKALYWVDDDIKQAKKNGYSFDTLYSLLLELLQGNLVNNNN